MDRSLDSLPVEPARTTPESIGSEAARTGSALGVVGGKLGRKTDPNKPREGRWIAKPRRSRWTIEWGGWGAIPLGIFPMPLRLTVLHFYGKDAEQLTLWTYSGLLIALGLYLGVREYWAHRVRGADRALLDGGFGDQYPVEITFVAKGKRIGADRGVLWFADGFIGFSGKAASFVLAATDVKVYSKAIQAKKTSPAHAAGTIQLVGAPIGAHLLVRALGKQNKAYHKRLGEFEKETADLDAERFWPPLTPYRETVVDKHSRPHGRR